MTRLNGKVALISGGSNGLGASHARTIVREGGKVVIGDLDLVAGEALAAELGDAARFVKLDVREDDDWRNAVQTAIDAFGALNILVNNAGVLREGGVRATTDEDWNFVIGINLTGTFKGIRAAADTLAKHAPASIINVSSTAGLKGFAQTPSYVASKFGVRGLTKSTAIELAPLGIRVNSIHPGNTKTRMIDGLYQDFSHVAQGRAGEQQEISNLVLYLASDESSFSTGAEFVADGGETAGLPEIARSDDQSFTK